MDLHSHFITSETLISKAKLALCAVSIKRWTFRGGRPSIQYHRHLYGHPELDLLNFSRATTTKGTTMANTGDITASFLESVPSIAVISALATLVH